MKTSTSIPIIIIFLLLLAGCATMVTLNPDFYANMLAYQPEPSRTRIDATVALGVNHVMTPDMRIKWRQWGNNDETINNYCTAVGSTIAGDIVQSGMFTSVLPNPPAPDYIIQIRSEEQASPEFRFVVRAEVLDADRKPVSSHSREGRLGTTLTTYNLKSVLPQVMAALRGDILSGVLARIEQRRQQAALAEAAVYEKTPLPELLASTDRSVTTARARNRAFIAAKNQQLPAILRDSKTDELTALVVRIEQTILDLNHESEVAKDRAQQAAAAEGDPQQIDELRGLAISYRERIELLKPVLAALKEEIANRNR